MSYFYYFWTMSKNSLLIYKNQNIMKPTKNLLLMLACLTFIIVIGAGTYEHVTMVPRWKLAPPSSLTMFQGEFGINPGNFWRFIHPINLLLLIIALVLNWKTTRRKNILIALGGYIIIIVATATYFVPELMKIMATPFANTINADLQARAALWEKLSLCRLVVMIVLALQLLSCLTKSPESNRS